MFGFFNNNNNNDIFGTNNGINPAGQQAAINNLTASGSPDPSITQDLINRGFNPVNGNPLHPTFFQKGGGAQIGIGAISFILHL